jgi:fucose permease
VEESAAPLPIITFMAFAILFLLYVGAEVSFGGWIHTFITSSTLGDMRTASLFNTAFWVAITVGRLLMIPLAIKFTPRRLVLACLSGAVGSISLVLLFPGSITAARMMILGVGLSIASLFPITFAITERMIQITGTRNGILWAVGSAGGIILPWFVGMELQILGQMLFLKHFCLVGVLLCWFSWLFLLIEDLTRLLSVLKITPTTYRERLIRCNRSTA